MTRAIKMITVFTFLAPVVFAGAARGQSDGTTGIATDAEDDGSAAGPPSAPNPVGEPLGLGGDWLGLKPHLASEGIIVSSHYISEAAWNYTGERRQKVDETGEFNVGAQMKGLIAGVPSGELGFGIARTHINGRLARAELLAERPGQASELELELHCGFRPFRYLQLRPNLQWVHHAGGNASARGVGVAG